MCFLQRDHRGAFFSFSFLFFVPECKLDNIIDLSSQVEKDCQRFFLGGGIVILRLCSISVIEHYALLSA